MTIRGVLLVGALGVGTLALPTSAAADFKPAYENEGCGSFRGAPPGTEETLGNLPAENAFFPSTNGSNGDFSTWGSRWSTTAASNRRSLSVSTTVVDAPEAGPADFSVAVTSSDWGRADGGQIPYRHDDDDLYIHNAGWPDSSGSSSDYILAIPSLRRPSPYFEEGTTAQQAANTLATDPPIRTQRPEIFDFALASDGQTALILLASDVGNGLTSVWLGSTGQARQIGSLEWLNGIEAANGFFYAAHNEGGNAQLISVDDESGAVTPVPHSLPNAASYGIQDVTPDGRFLVATVGSGFEQQWYRVEVASGQTVPLSVRSDGVLQSMSSSGNISDDGSLFVFSRRGPFGENSRELYLRNADTSTTSTISSDNQNVYAPGISTDGRYVYWYTDQPSTTFYDREQDETFKVDGSFGHQLTSIVARSGGYWSLVGGNSTSGNAFDLVLFTDPRACGADSDGDGVSDLNDNCVDLPNLLQRDRDADGEGDDCDPPESDPRNVPPGFDVRDRWWTFPDADGDMIPDHWETNGVWVEDVFLDLEAMGALPTRKDLFLHVDYGLSAERLQPEAWRLFTEALLATHLKDPETGVPDRQGVTVHVDLGANSVMDPSSGSRWSARNSGLGTATQSSFGDSTADDLYGAAARSPRYLSSGRGGSEFGDVPPLFKYLCVCSESTSYGRGYFDTETFGLFGIGDLDSIELLATVGYKDDEGTVTQADFSGLSSEERRVRLAHVQAALIMHELGHTLGLGHSGDSSGDAGATDHLSIMRYPYVALGGVPVSTEGQADSYVLTYNQVGLPDQPLHDEARLRSPIDAAYSANSPFYFTNPDGISKYNVTYAGFGSVLLVPGWHGRMGRLLYGELEAPTIDAEESFEIEPLSEADVNAYLSYLNRDADDDGVRDFIEMVPPEDGDGIAASLDNCPRVSNVDQTDSDGDGTGDACDYVADSDSDGVGDLIDNCPAVTNPDQSDADGDGLGDVCDDASRPLVSGVVVPGTNAAGWLSDVSAVIAWSAVDPGFSLGPDTFTIESTPIAEGVSTYVSPEVCDAQGNCAMGVLEVSADFTAPTIAASVSPVANAVGWHSGDALVTFECADTLSGVASCSDPVVVDTDGENQWVVGVATDVAGNSVELLVDDINIDTVPPTIFGSVVPELNSSGWANAPVMVSFECVDATSGVASCSEPVSVVSDGAGQLVGGLAVDRAGNSASTSVTVSIDTVAPVVTLDAPEDGSSVRADEYIAPTCSATDELSGLNGGCTVTLSDPIPAVGGDRYTATAVATDIAGNETSVSSTFTVITDVFAPEIIATPDRPANANGWYQGPVTWSFECFDENAGMATCPGPVMVNTEGASQAFTVTARDNVGNVGSLTVAGINIDTTGPTISASFEQVANGAAWFDQELVVTFDCADSLSGVRDCTPPTIVSNGVDQTVAGSVTDAAGNTATVELIGLNVDVENPTIVASAAPAPNDAGWNNTTVTVTFECADAISGIAECSPDQTLTSEGAGQVAAGQATDVAGNTETATVTVSIDLTPPTVVLDAPADGTSILLDEYVAPTCAASDDLSGVNGSCTVTVSDPTPVVGGLVYTATAQASDLADNVSTVSSTYTVIIDDEAPTIVANPDLAPNGDGWYDAAVTFGFECFDDGVGVADCPDPIIVNTDGANQSFTVQATDNAGNTGTLTVSGINIDTQAPTITFTGAEPSYTVSDQILIACAPTDTLSGVASSDCGTVDVLAVDYASTVGAPSTTGTFTITATAVDAAGNTATESVTFEILVDQDSLIDVLTTIIPNGGPGSNGLYAKLRQGDYAAFINQVEAKCCLPANGKLFTRAQADLLTELATQLL